MLEMLPASASHLAKRAVRDCDLFLAVGTSGSVTPAADFVRNASYAGARTILVNLEPMQPRNPSRLAFFWTRQARVTYLGGSFVPRCSTAAGAET